ncbi:TPA: hypothetical protein ACOEB8_004182, partial [Enterobacter ludwigii]
AGREPKGARGGILVFSENLLIGFQSRHATPRHATPRHATPRHATPRHATPRHATPRHAGPYP